MTRDALPPTHPDATGGAPHESDSVAAKAEASDGPWPLFARWFADAQAKELNDPNAVALATATRDGRPSVRMVLMKDFSPSGVVIYTNMHSRKGGELTTNPYAALLFHWKSLRRQVRIEGAVERVTEAEADAYFASRPRDARIGAWASQQSQPLASRTVFLGDIARETARFGISTVPRPPHWHGARIVPDTFEFWIDRPFRLHDRITFARGDDGAWQQGRLYP